MPNQRSRPSLDYVLDLLADLDDGEVSVLLDDFNHTTASNITVSDAIELFEKARPSARSGKQCDSASLCPQPLGKRISSAPAAIPSPTRSAPPPPVAPQPIPSRPQTPVAPAEPAPSAADLDVPDSPEPAERPRTAGGTQGGSRARPRAYKRISRPAPRLTNPLASPDLCDLLASYLAELPSPPVSPLSLGGGVPSLTSSRSASTVSAEEESGTRIFGTKFRKTRRQRQSEPASWAGWTKRQSSSPVRRLIRAALAPIPAYESIEAQLFILSLIFFLGPGIYTALLGIGGGGLKDPTPVTHSFIVYSGTMAVFGFFAGPLVSKLGYRLSLLLGSGSYALYAASLAFVKWQQVRNGPDVGWILMPAASIQGMTNAVQWAAQGSMMLTYPAPSQTAKYTSMNFAIFNMGAMTGSVVVMLQNMHSTTVEVNMATYIAYTGVMALAMPLSMLILDPEQVTGIHGAQGDKLSRDKASPPTSPDPSECSGSTSTWTSASSASTAEAPVSLATHLGRFLHRLKTDSYILVLFPLMFASNYIQPYYFNDVNMLHFSVRTRALNVIIYYAAGIPALYLVGALLNNTSGLPGLSTRRARAVLGLAFAVAVFSTVLGAAAHWQAGAAARAAAAGTGPLLDFADGAGGPRGYLPAGLLFLGFGASQFVFWNSIYWFLGTLAAASETAQVADFAGFLKSLQSFGAAAAWAVSAAGPGSGVDLGLVWGIVVGSLAVAAPVLVARSGRIVEGDDCERGCEDVCDIGNGNLAFRSGRCAPDGGMSCYRQDNSGNVLFCAIFAPPGSFRP
ncbi:hypothetical protein P8C59_009384 [Phyllachora maydis]|uniref:Uncharacterized protein n=1 Tax=Phyllachora maydis TaxID=1825666 RepID=A0AAD9ML69_9PEZI|nr:hypothetical protein P8C59_009384 [Phyllachora maydis]